MAESLERAIDLTQILVIKVMSLTDTALHHHFFALKIDRESYLA